jgi:tetratricopeptide (TPR) repeat protein
MKCAHYIVFSVLAAALSAAAQTADTSDAGKGALSEEQIRTMEQRVAAINDPAARLFFQANIYRAKGEFEQALQTLARLNVFYAHDQRWITRSELLTAKLYLDMGMPEQAEVTARQVEFLNQGTEAAETARRFREKIEQMDKQSDA